MRPESYNTIYRNQRIQWFTRMIRMYGFEEVYSTVVESDRELVDEAEKKYTKMKEKEIKEEEEWKKLLAESQL